jgi:hypothetical protein
MGRQQKGNLCFQATSKYDGYSGGVIGITNYEFISELTVIDHIGAIKHN